MLGIDINLSKEIFTWEKFKQSFRIFFVQNLVLFMVVFLITLLCLAINKDYLILYYTKISIPFVLFFYLFSYTLLYYSLFVKKYKKHHIEFIYGNKPNLLDKNFIKCLLLLFLFFLPIDLPFFLSYEYESLLYEVGNQIVRIFLCHISYHSGLLGLKITEKTNPSLQTN